MRRKRLPSILMAVAACSLARPASAEMVVFYGKVLLEDGSPPGHLVGIQRVCDGMEHPIREGSASGKTGEFTVRLEVSDFGGVFSGNFNGFGMLPCALEATLDGFASSRLDMSDRRLTMNPQLPNIVLTRSVRGSLVDLDRGPSVPHGASRPWSQALKYIEARDWLAAETPLRAVVQAAPKFAAGWVALGTSCQNQHKAAEARPALERAIELDPKPLPPLYMLANVVYELKDWEAAAKTSQALIQSDARHVYLEAYVLNAIARYEMKDLDGALDRMREVMRLDKRQDLPRAEYILGTIEEARQEYESAAAHMREYLAKNPHAKDAAEVRDRIANLGHAKAADLSTELSSPDLRAPAAGEAPVPGGLKAFAAIARMPAPASSADFFLQYCRAITGPNVENQTLESAGAVHAFIEVVGELEQLGAREADRVVVQMAVDSEEHRHKTERVLALFGWKLVRNGDALSAEPADQAIDGLRQRIPAAFGIDELDLRAAIESGHPFQFEFPIESARLIGGAAWSVVLKGVPDVRGGPADIFIRDWRFARVYTGLGAMEPDTAGAVVSAVGLATLLTKYSNLLADAGDALTLSENHVTAPGGAKANAAWAKLAGANPQNPASFLRALLDKDNGRLMDFYYDLAHADAAHQQFFTASPASAEGFYKWYRDSLPSRRAEERWQAIILQKLRLDSAGKAIFPGGRQAWTTAAQSDAEALPRVSSLRALAAEIRLEQQRGAALDQASAALLAQHYDEWQYLFPYFEKLPGLGAAEFQALAGFADDAAKAPAERQAVLMGDWHSLVELVVLAGEAGSLDQAGAANAFGHVADALRSANPSAKSIEALREMSGGATDLDEAIPARLLRLSGARRDAYERVKALQNVPSIHSLGDSPDAVKTLAALSGAVYAALLDPQYLLVAEDPRLLAKHNFLPAGGDKRAPLFADSALIVSNSPPGSNLAGGFARFREVTRALDRRRVKASAAEEAATEAMAPEEVAQPSPAPAEPGPRPPTEALFRASGRIVEVYATVTDSRGRYVDDLNASQFTILEGGHPKPVFAFENHTSSVSVALLFDATGSMDTALPSLKRAALQLLDELRPEDSVAVYSFNDRITELQPYTTDKVAAKRAVLRAHAAGTTALYDALLRVNHDLAGRAGKKVIIVFTDGDDNASMLTSDAAILRAKGRGIPIYTIAEGDALVHQQLIGQLANISRATGGTSFLIRKLSDIGAVFQKVSEDLMHGYLLAFQPSEGEEHGWRKIEVVLANGKGRQVRAREGYYPE
jgi:VWFA-related protein